MITNYQRVKAFHERFDSTVNESFKICDKDLRFKLIREELVELEDALLRKNPADIAKELTDLLYVVYGTGVAWGIDLDETMYLVHASNMSKLGADNKPVYRADGKIMKGPYYREPNLESLKCLIPTKTDPAMAVEKSAAKSADQDN